MASEPRLPRAWDSDDPRDLPLIEENLRLLLRDLVRQADRRHPPTVAMAQGWHRRIYENVRLPVAYYAGEVRDDDPRFPELVDYEVVIGGAHGVPARRVPGELARFESAMGTAVARLDRFVRPNARPDDAGRLHSVLALCALAHGEWVRIHPFANGNGRTARLWANWCALRYGLPPFVRLKPRSESEAYASAAARSMRGDHRAMVAVLADQLAARLEGAAEPG